MEAGKRVQTVQDWVSISEKWQKLLGASVAPYVCQFFLDIYHACQSHAIANDRPSTTYACVDHFLRAVNSIDWNDFTDYIDKIIDAVPELSTAFKTYFVAEAWVLTSVRLQTTQGTWNPSFRVTLPTKRKIITEILDQASTAFLSRPNLITKPKKVICNEVEQTVGSALLHLVRHSDFMESFIRAMKAESNFAPMGNEPLLGDAGASKPMIEHFRHDNKSQQQHQHHHHGTEGKEEEASDEIVALADSDTDTEGEDHGGDGSKGRPSRDEDEDRAVEKLIGSAEDQVVGFFEARELNEPNGNVSEISGELVENPITGDIEERIEDAQLAQIHQQANNGSDVIDSNPLHASFPNGVESIHDMTPVGAAEEGSYHEEDSLPTGQEAEKGQETDGAHPRFTSVIDDIPF